MSKLINDIFDNISPEEHNDIIKQVNQFQIDDPNYNEFYGTDKSYFLSEIKEKGFNPLGITVMVCEETFIMETKEECDRAWEIFKPEGWWYTLDEWEKVHNEYVNDMYDGDFTKSPKVYSLSNKFSFKSKH